MNPQLQNKLLKNTIFGFIQTNKNKRIEKKTKKLTTYRFEDEEER